MASIYDKASLVLIPSGTKTSKVYSQKPVNGDGDFTFSRSTAATRVNADGNIEKETQNLLLQSNQFDTSWTNVNSSETSGQSGYDGSNNAWLLTKTAANGRIYQSVSTSGVQTFSLYAKANASNWISLWTNVGTSYFDLANGTKGSTTASTTIGSEMVSVGNGWYRCSLIFNTSILNVRIYPADGDLDTSGTSGSIYIQDAQLEQGLVARDYIETTTAAVEGGITDNVPRLDYTDSSCPALLLEPQRSNLVTQSEYFGDSSWSEYVFGGASLTRTFGYESPEGNNNAYKFDVVVGTGGVLLTNNITINPANAQTLSIWMKGQNGGEKVMLALRNTGSSGASGNVITLTSEWARYDVTLTTAAADRGFQFRMLSTNGVVDQTIYVYGATLEEGSYATSYIPTYGSAVTRNGESCIKTGISSLIGQTEGTLFLEAKSFSDVYPSNTYTSITNSTGSNRIIIGIASQSNQLRIVGVFGGVSNGGNNYTISDTTNYFKVAVKYYGSTLDVFINGEKKTSQSFGGYSNLVDAVRFDDGNGALPFEGDVKQRLIFPTALTDQELIDLTTL